MALICRELATSRPVSTRSGENTASRSFHVYDDTTPLTSPTDVYLRFGTGGSPDGLPTYRDQFPGAAIPLLATSVNVTRVPEQSDLYLVEWQYTEIEGGALGILQPKQPKDIGYVEVTGSLNGEFVDCWRALSQSEISALVVQGGTYQYGTPSSNAGENDIGGEEIDAAGEPVSCGVRQFEFAYGVTAGLVPNMAFFATFVGTRNAVPFSGMGVGRVLYLGASVRRIEEHKWSIEHRFVADQFLHMRQACQKWPNGQPRTSTRVLGDGSLYAYASRVFFVQPYPSLTDFYSLSPYFAGVA